MCRDGDDDWVAVEIKRVGTISAVEQLCRYLELIRVEPGMGSCRGVLAAQVVKPQARTLAEARGIDCVEVDLVAVRGEREPDLARVDEVSARVDHGFGPAVAVPVRGVR